MKFQKSALNKCRNKQHDKDTHVCVYNNSVHTEVTNLRCVWGTGNVGRIVGRVRMM